MDIVNMPPAFLAMTGTRPNFLQTILAGLEQGQNMRLARMKEEEARMKMEDMKAQRERAGALRTELGQAFEPTRPRPFEQMGVNPTAGVLSGMLPGAPGVGEMISRTMQPVMEQTRGPQIQPSLNNPQTQLQVARALARNGSPDDLRQFMQTLSGQQSREGIAANSLAQKREALIANTTMKIAKIAADMEKVDKLIAEHQRSGNQTDQRARDLAAAKNSLLRELMGTSNDFKAKLALVEHGYNMEEIGAKPFQVDVENPVTGGIEKKVGPASAFTGVGAQSAVHPSVQDVGSIEYPPNAAVPPVANPVPDEYRGAPNTAQLPIRIDETKKTPGKGMPNSGVPVGGGVGLSLYRDTATTAQTTPEPVSPTEPGIKTFPTGKVSETKKNEWKMAAAQKKQEFDRDLKTMLEDRKDERAALLWEEYKPAYAEVVNELNMGRDDNAAANKMDQILQQFADDLVKLGVKNEFTDKQNRRKEEGLNRRFDVKEANAFERQQRGLASASEQIAQRGEIASAAQNVRLDAASATRSLNEQGRLKQQREGFGQKVFLQKDAQEARAASEQRKMEFRKEADAAKKALSPKTGLTLQQEAGKAMADALKLHGQMVGKKHADAANEADTFLRGTESMYQRGDKIAGDINLIRAIAKLTDPDSVIREGEYNVYAQQIDRLNDQARKFMTWVGSKNSDGTTRLLTEPQRKAYLNQLKDLQKMYTDLNTRKIKWARGPAYQTLKEKGFEPAQIEAALQFFGGSDESDRLLKLEHVTDEGSPAPAPLAATAEEYFKMNPLPGASK